jgi:predicted nucleic acid-binding protein
MIFVEMIEVDSRLFEQGWQLFQRYDDKSYSLTDCISFEVMRRFNLTVALTFDHHFNQAGFMVLPS